MAGIVSKDIYRLVKTTTTEIDIMDRIYHGDVDAYNIDIEFYGVTSISGTCNLHFVLPDGTALDKDDSDGVVIDGNNVKYTLPTYLYQQSGNLTMYVQFMNSNIYTPLKVNFKNIVAIPDGGEEVVATTTYPVWYDEVVTNEDERVAAELIRVSNEVSRVTAEDARATWEEFNSSTVYAVGEKVYYPTTGSSYILHTASGVANTLPTDTDYWQIIVEKGASGTIDALSATDITGVIAGDGSNIIVASADDLPYVNTTSGLTATDTQAAIDELASEKEDKTNIGDRTYTEQNYVTDSETVTASIDALDIAIASAGGGFNTYEYGNEITLTWAQIQTKCLAGDFSGIAVGDWKSIVVGAETVIMEVAGIDTYYGYASNGKHNIDFISRDCLSATYKMNPTKTSIGGWLASALYTAMNGTGGIYDSLPAEVKAVIGTKLMLLENKASSNSTSWAWHTETKLWLPAELEVFGYQSGSQIGYGSGNFKQYPLFAGSEKHIIKGAGNGGSATTWWELSPGRASTELFCYVGDNGIAHHYYPDSDYRIPLCFRVS